MAPSRTAAAAVPSRGKYNYTEETLTGRLSCPHCDRKFKPQGFKKHEATCKKHVNVEREQETFGLEYQKDQQRGRTEYHPSSGREPLHQAFNEFRVDVHDTTEGLPVDEEPWRPFSSQGDFEFAEITLDASLNKSQIDGLLSLIARIATGQVRITLKNDTDFRNVLCSATTQVSPFTKHDITVPYKREERVYEVHALPIWEWALDLLENPLLAPHFVWDAQRVYKHNGTEFEQFYDEPWTADHWWDIQSNLPHDLVAAPLCFIVYADKTRLSSHGTVKGYPVVVRCANLPVGIRNGEGIGGGRVIGLLPIVSEDASEEGKKSFTNLKHVVWHESFVKFLELVAQYSKTGYSYKCFDQVLRWLFPIILILSADYEEQCMMSLIHGHHSKCPCPVCIVPLDELHDLSKSFRLRSMQDAMTALDVYEESKARGEELLKALGLRAVKNVLWIVAHSDPHDAISLDRLHALHLGLWKHLLNELKKILKSLGREAESLFEEEVANFPRWRDCNHFNTVIHMSFSDGNKMQDLSKQSFYAALSILKQSNSPEGNQLLRLIGSYLQLDSYIGLDVHTMSTLDAIEAELLVFNNALKDYVQCAAESSIEDLRLDWNFPKILRVNQNKFTVSLLRGRVDTFDEQRNHKDNEVDLGTTAEDNLDLAVAQGHIKLGSPQQLVSIQDIENACSPADRAFQDFRRKFSTFLNTSLPGYGYELRRWITLPANFQICEYRYLKVNYESTVDWKQATDYLWCNPSFHGQPRYDCALIQLTPEQSAFVKLILMFKCHLPDIDGSFNFALVQPYTAGTGAHRRIDRELKLTRVKAVPRANSTFVPLASVIRGAVLFPDRDHQGEFIIVDHIDSDMFLHMKTRARQ
ncbi:hypothetical protein DFJ58DRAFT_712860 [Suillus subalutaceus]|uniref:uncharacterized protein n=1 Tax=Suillus subalutaceus TaxID=48586 RepID=UPI001B8773E9|nr:uncharacterized protein DFJ58DRAFT_712860 [Suillus subalutaceus]KAG1876628.1 hypothetical protein DFJ58DRAFT_712860 [Suillus subalutaceus]